MMIISKSQIREEKCRDLVVITHFNPLARCLERGERHHRRCPMG
jgi:hypothetical protein